MYIKSVDFTDTAMMQQPFSTKFIQCGNNVPNNTFDSLLGCYKYEIGSHEYFNDFPVF